jgi:hypothetical protein
MEDSRLALLIENGFTPLKNTSKECFAARGTYIMLSLINATLVTDSLGNTLTARTHLNVSEIDFVPRPGIFECI